MSTRVPHVSRPVSYWTHLASLMSKLGARNRVELAIYAYETERVAR
jgi:hypothetical protein